MPLDPENRELIVQGGGQVVNGKWPVGSPIFFLCDIQISRGLIYHPTVCQPDGVWKPTSSCESK